MLCLANRLRVPRFQKSMGHMHFPVGFADAEHRLLSSELRLPKELFELPRLGGCYLCS